MARNFEELSVSGAKEKQTKSQSKPVNRTMNQSPSKPVKTSVKPKGALPLEIFKVKHFACPTKSFREIFRDLKVYFDCNNKICSKQMLFLNAHKWNSMIKHISVGVAVCFY